LFHSGSTYSPLTTLPSLRYHQYITYLYTHQTDSYLQLLHQSQHPPTSYTNLSTINTYPALTTPPILTSTCCTYIYLPDHQITERQLYNTTTHYALITYTNINRPLFTTTLTISIHTTITTTSFHYSLIKPPTTITSTNHHNNYHHSNITLPPSLTSGTFTNYLIISLVHFINISAYQTTTISSSLHFTIPYLTSLRQPINNNSHIPSPIITIINKTLLYSYYHHQNHINNTYHHINTLYHTTYTLHHHHNYHLLPHQHLPLFTPLSSPLPYSSLSSGSAHQPTGPTRLFHRHLSYKYYSTSRK
jgi:hypothetical protein